MVNIYLLFFLAMLLSTLSNDTLDLWIKNLGDYSK